MAPCNLTCAAAATLTFELRHHRRVERITWVLPAMYRLNVARLVANVPIQPAAGFVDTSRLGHNFTLVVNKKASKGGSLEDTASIVTKACHRPCDHSVILIMQIQLLNRPTVDLNSFQV
jgi:hypothetical protein